MCFRSLSALLVLGFASSLGGAVLSPPAARARSSVSPSAVLAKADQRLETSGAGVSFPETGQATEKSADKTLAPYFHVAGDDSGTERLPLKETSADVQIAGVIARVRVHQEFENSGTKPIEAVYVFPASTRAAVHGMRMKIGERTIEAKIEKRQSAREQYEQAKQQGKRASLLEQQRPNVFTMNVANIMPKDRIEVELEYSELLIPEDATYEFVYPTVVGPRYGGGADPERDQWIANPYLTEGQKEPYRFDLKLRLETAIALKEVSSPSHKVSVNYSSPGSAEVTLDGPGGGNKDFVLRYRLAGDAIESGLLLWQGEQEGFFVLMMEPPARPTQAQIPPREYIFLLDVSGSMHGFPLDTAKALMKSLLGQLRPSDYFNVVFFSGASWVMSERGSIAATRGNIEQAIASIERQQGGGGTELMGGLEAAYRIPKLREGLSRSVVAVTDGYVGVEAKAFKFIREHLNEANLFAFGIGSSVNRGLIEGMARAGLGEPFVVLNPNAANAEAEKLREYIQYPVLSGINVRFDGFDAREVAPAKVPDLMARRPIVVFGKFTGEAKGAIEVTGFSGGGKFAQKLLVGREALKADNAPIRWLWARKWVAMLDDEMHLGAATEIEEAITELGLSYNLLTSFTSFVAIDSEVVNKSGGSERVRQPLPLPEGVSNYAVGDVATASGAAPMRYRAAMGAPATALRGMVAEDLRQAPGEKAESKPKKESASARLKVVRSRVAGLGDAGALLKLVDQEVRAAATQCPAAQARLTLRLFVDKAGKVVKVEVVQTTDSTLAACLQRKLTSMVSSSASSGPTLGTLEIVLETRL